MEKIIQQLTEQLNGLMNAVQGYITQLKLEILETNKSRVVYEEKQRALVAKQVELEEREAKIAHIEKVDEFKFALDARGMDIANKEAELTRREESAKVAEADLKARITRLEMEENDVRIARDQLTRDEKQFLANKKAFEEKVSAFK